MGGSDNPGVSGDAASADVFATQLQTALPRPRMRTGFSTADDAVYFWTHSALRVAP